MLRLMNYVEMFKLFLWSYGAYFVWNVAKTSTERLGGIKIKKGRKQKKFKLVVLLNFKGLKFLSKIIFIYNRTFKKNLYLSWETFLFLKLILDSDKK